MADSPVKKYVDYAAEQVDEQAILDKYNAATIAQFNQQREQNRQSENKFYNQMYNTQKTAMDTIRQSNAAAVSSGASRGVQAANELSALLGLQQESVESATEIAQANRQTAQEETAAVLENVLNAYQQAQNERSQLVSQGIEAASVEATKEQTAATQQEAQTNQMKLYIEALETGVDDYLAALAQTNKDYTKGSAEGDVALTTALQAIKLPESGDYASVWGRFWGGNYSSTIPSKIEPINNTVNTIIKQFGLEENKEQYQAQLQEIKDIIKDADNDNNVSKARKITGITNTVWDNRDIVSQAVKTLYQNLLNNIRADYTKKLNKAE